MMPRGDGTGPRGEGPGTGRGLGRMTGGKMGQRPGRGPGGNCICPACGRKVPHSAGTPCTGMNCPDCNTPMSRE